MIDGLHHIAILSSNRERALQFYESALGFVCVRTQTRPEREDEILWLVGYGMTLEIFVCANRPMRPSYPEAYGLRHLALRVECVQAVRNRLLEQGFSVEEIRADSFDGCLMTFVKDPDGLPIELHE